MLIHNIPYYNNISAHIGAGAQWLSAIRGFSPTRATPACAPAPICFS